MERHVFFRLYLLCLCIGLAYATVTGYRWLHDVRTALVATVER